MHQEGNTLGWLDSPRELQRFGRGEGKARAFWREVVTPGAWRRNTRILGCVSREEAAALKSNIDQEEASDLEFMT